MTDTAPEDATPRPTRNRPLLAAVGVVAVAAVAVTAGVFIGRGIAPAPQAGSASVADVSAAAQAATAVASYGEARGSASVHQDEALVTTEWLADNLGDERVVIIEVSEGRSTEGDPLGAYAQGHIPGAIGLVWYRDFVQRQTRDLVTQEQFTELAQAAGINPDSTVVLYGDANNWFAAYAAWIFKLYGFEDVKLLDGGRVKWVAEGQVLDQAAPTPATGTWEALAPNRDIRAFQNEVLSVVTGEQPGVIIDIRGAAEFNGEIGVAEGFGGEAAAKWGHIPGAINAPWGQIVNQPADGGDAAFKSVEEIKAHYAALGVDGSVPIYVYCRIGERASHTWYALSQLLGYDVKLYDGSWTEWGNSVAVPVANPTLEASGGFSGLWGGN